MDVTLPMEMMNSIVEENSTSLGVGVTEIVLCSIVDLPCLAVENTAQIWVPG
jgi:hypothetical protein